MKEKVYEIVAEFRAVFTGRSNLADAIIPPATFLIVNALSNFEYALWGALGTAFAIALFRLLKRQSLIYALGGLAAAVLAMLVARWLGRAEGYFLPGIITSGVFAIASVVSIAAGRPLVAWTSHLTRRWPINWYWHAKVRPAYSEVTWAWVAYFAIQLSLQLKLFQEGAVALLGFLNIVTGWPGTIVLLVVSYLYGTWRLQNLGGPSIEEFEAGAEPPWEGQRRGF